MQSYKRSVRVAELIQQAISKIVQDMNNPGIGFVTILDVKLTDDLSYAKVFFSVIGSEDEIAQSCAVLQQSITTIRYQLSAKVKMRRTPDIDFIFDDTPVKADRIIGLLEKIKSEKNESNADE